MVKISDCRETRIFPMLNKHLLVIFQAIVYDIYSVDDELDLDCVTLASDRRRS